MRNPCLRTEDVKRGRTFAAPVMGNTNTKRAMDKQNHMFDPEPVRPKCLDPRNRRKACQMGVSHHALLEHSHSRKTTTCSVMCNSRKVKRYTLAYCVGIFVAVYGYRRIVKDFVGTKIKEQEEYSQFYQLVSKVAGRCRIKKPAHELLPKTTTTALPNSLHTTDKVVICNR